MPLFLSTLHAHPVSKPAPLTDIAKLATRSMGHTFVIGICAGLVLFVLWSLYTAYLRAQLRSSERDVQQFSGQANEKDPYQSIEPLPDFEWAETPPIRNAVFKPKYHLTMALESISLSDIIALDNTYVERMQVRKSIMDENPDATISCNTVCAPAVLELHEWVFGTYLPTRFPNTYRLATGPKRSLFNRASASSIALAQPSPLEALRSLGEHVDADFLLLLPSSQAPDGSPIYHLQAFVCCFPSGFSLRQRLGSPLAEIHIPVPGYKAKLEKSMDRFFARIECGQAVKRSNWAITTDDLLFKEGGNHFHTSSLKEKESEEIEEQKRNVVVQNCRIRSERQVLFRLPKTRALVFSFETYQYKLSEAKKEGYADALAEAIEGLRNGNVPEMNHYKRGTVWAEPVLEYLRS